jgi:hypothetical protein
MLLSSAFVFQVDAIVPGYMVGIVEQPVIVAASSSAGQNSCDTFSPIPDGNLLEYRD